VCHAILVSKPLQSKYGNHKTLNITHKRCQIDEYCMETKIDHLVSARFKLCTRLADIDDQFWNYALGAGAGNCMRSICYITSHRGKCRTFFFQSLKYLRHI
jgi:hypothetical protein